MQNENNDNLNLLTLGFGTMGVAEAGNQVNTLLDSRCVHYTDSDYHYLVGEIPWRQGWILHISVVLFQLEDLLNGIVPFLIDTGVTFKVVKNFELAKDLLDGHLGNKLIGKIITIYPEKPETANRLAKELIKLTQDFKGPRIPTDFHLGGCVYVRYGSGNAILRTNSEGNAEKYILDAHQKPIIDNYSVPFELPKGIMWPFDGILYKKRAVQKKVINRIYRTIKPLKCDARGFVWKALYVKGLFRTGVCVIKQGKLNMCSDEYGNDIHNRILWQKELHDRLKDLVPIPRIIDMFQEDGDTYLVMDMIDGVTLYRRKLEINRRSLSWTALEINSKVLIIDYILSIIKIIETLHLNGFVHRDITPVNFIIDKKEQIYLIDIELAYSLEQKKPSPPFGIGTPGFISPEQAKSEIPTIKEDIFGLSATIVWLFTGLLPIHFVDNDGELMGEHLDFFIREKNITQLVVAGLGTCPEERPELSTFSEALGSYKLSLQSDLSSREHFTGGTIVSDKRLDRLIQAGINSLSTPPMLMKSELWLSKSPQKEIVIGNMQKEYVLGKSLFGGISGVLYFLATAKTAGYNIDRCINSYKKGWDYLQNDNLSSFSVTSTGYYYGLAGIAVALMKGINADLLRNDIDVTTIIHDCLSPESMELDLSIGAAGQGLALIRCIEYLSDEHANALLARIVSFILAAQEKDGSWKTKSGKVSERREKQISFANGTAGITYFLLEHYLQFGNVEVRNAAMSALKWLEAKSGNLVGLLNSAANMNRKEDTAYLNDQGAGIVLTFIKAYEALKIDKYKFEVEQALSKNSECIVNDNLSQVGGLSGLGEIYLEAARVFQNDEWMNRAGWMVELFLHTYKDIKGSIFWLTEQVITPTADLMLGNSGILHFLIRYRTKGKISHCIL